VLARELAATARERGLVWTPAQVRERLGREGLADLADELLLTAPGRRRTTSSAHRQDHLRWCTREAAQRPDRLLGHLRPPRGLGDGDLTGQIDSRGSCGWKKSAEGRLGPSWTSRATFRRGTTYQSTEPDHP